MLTYTGFHISNTRVRHVLSDTQNRTENIYETASLKSEWVSALTGGSRAHYGLLIAILAAVIMWFIIERTTFGYEMKSVGFNRHASLYAGRSVERRVGEYTSLRELRLSEVRLVLLAE